MAVAVAGWGVERKKKKDGNNPNPNLAFPPDRPPAWGLGLPPACPPLCVQGVAQERFAQMTDWNYYEAARRFQRVLEAAGVVSALRRQGIQVRSLPPASSPPTPRAPA